MTRPTSRSHARRDSLWGDRAAEFAAQLAATIDPGARVAHDEDPDDATEERLSDWDSDRRADVEEARNERAFWGEAS